MSTYVRQLRKSFSRLSPVDPEASQNAEGPSPSSSLKKSGKTKIPSKKTTKSPRKLGSKSKAERGSRSRTSRRRHHAHSHSHSHSHTHTSRPQSTTVDELADYFANTDEDSDVEVDFIGTADFESHDSSSAALTNSDFACLSPEEIVREQNVQIMRIGDLLHIPESNASNLLRSYQWKTEKLLSHYFDNPHKVLIAAGLDPSSITTKDSNSSVSACQTLTGIEECLICCEYVGPSEACALSCGHRFCNDCWDTYLTMKITAADVLRIDCPGHQCSVTTPDEVIHDLVSDEKVYQKYLRFVTKSFVEDNVNVSWCPAPGCGNAVTTEKAQGQVVECTCGFRFCFTCHNEDHLPATCEHLRNWQAKSRDESETGHWIGANTKGCPKCDSHIEKNGGCNHMTCRQCSYEWCWMCMKMWKGHSDYYACEKYDRTKKKKKDRKKKGSKKRNQILQMEEEREVKKVALERYLTYFHKFLEFETAVGKAEEFIAKASEKMDELQSESHTLAEVLFIQKAAETSNSCHRVLRNSFIYAYYLEELESGTEKQLFDFIQTELEKTTSLLVTMMDAPGLMKRRAEIMNLTYLAKTKQDNLLSSVANGLEEFV
eukprot:TRINITY_DN350_c0_g4_i1.p1 TRINITY_DN350_c0_g4~~TRINITY_DN350_c0_g4_i1.p1  ORF type:complete len:601 (-),score=133.46 TRINITY_DN350_c0_g4_i1:125-1927(-)